MDAMKIMAERIRQKRKEMGMSLEILALKSKVSYNAIKQLEKHGKIGTVRVLLDVCSVLGLSVSIADKKKRELTDAEINDIIDSVTEAVSNRKRHIVTSFDDMDVFIKFDADIREHQEEDYTNGTGAWVTDSCTIKIRSIEFMQDEDFDVVQPDLEKIERAVEKNMMM